MFVAEVGLRSFSLYGNACVLLAPLIDSMPIFAGGEDALTLRIISLD